MFVKIVSKIIICIIYSCEAGSLLDEIVLDNIPHIFTYHIKRRLKVDQLLAIPSIKAGDCVYSVHNKKCYQKGNNRMWTTNERRVDQCKQVDSGQRV